MNMTIQLSDHFTYKKLLRFCFPPIVMMMFTSIYGVVDGLFVSNFVGKIPFAAINLVMPLCHDTRRLRLYDRGRRQRPGGQNPGQKTIRSGRIGISP